MALQPFWARLAAALPCVRAMAAFADVKEALLRFLSGVPIGAGGSSHSFGYGEDF